MDLKLSVLFDAIDKITKPLKSITGSSAATSKALRDTRQRLRELEAQQDRLKGFRSLKEGTRDLGKQLEAAQARATALGRALKASEAPTRAQTREYNAARRAAAQLGQQYNANQAKLNSMRQTLAAAGINTRSLSQHERTLRGDLAGVNQQLRTQQEQLKRISDRERQMAGARSAYGSAQGRAAHLAVAGVAAMSTGHHLVGAVAPTIEAAKDYQQQVAQFRALGIGDAQLADAEKFARGMNVMGTSATDNLKLLKETYSVLRDMHESEQVTPYLARMKFGIETVMAQRGQGSGHGEAAESMFMDLLKVAELRGAAKDPEKLKRVLDFATQAYVSSGGLVKPEDMLNMIKTGGVAAKQLDDTSFFFGLLHTMQEMGGHRAGTGLATAYQNWAAGRSTQQSAEELADLGLLNKDSVRYGKTGHITKLKPDALKDADLYRANPFEYLMTRVIPKINPAGTLNDQQVVSKINALFSGRKGGDLFASLYLERANIAKQLAAAPHAYGVDALYGEAKGTAAGGEAELLAKRADLYRELGTQALPIYVSALGYLVRVLRTLNTFAQAHPTLAKGILITAGAVGVLLTGVGGLLVAVGGILGPLAFVRYTFALMGGAGTVAATVLRVLSTILIGPLATALRLVGTVILFVGRAMLANPILLLITAIAAAAYLIYENWGPIKDFFVDLWGSISEALGNAWQFVKDSFNSVVTWIMAKIQPVINLVNRLVAGWHRLRGDTDASVNGNMPPDIQRLSDASGIPDPVISPTVRPTGTAAIGTGRAGTVVHRAGDNITIPVNGVQDPKATADQIAKALAAKDRADAAELRSRYQDHD